MSATGRPAGSSTTSSTLYLDGEQLTATTSGTTTTVTGARIIPLPSGGDVVRTGSGTSYYFEVPDPQGTNDLYLDYTAQNPTWRQFTPYGAPRGATTIWIDNRGFLNKPADPATGLTYAGARAYDPVTGQFISPDPILIPNDPQDLSWASGMRSLSQYFAGRPPQADGDFTFMLSEVDIETPDGVIVPRIIGFVSKGGLPKSLRIQLRDSGIQVFRATAFEKHAEKAADNFADNEFTQQISLGGKIVRVNSAVMNNPPCSQDCADAFNRYANTGRTPDEPQVAITTEDQGFLANGRIIDPEYAAQVTEQGGGINVFGGFANEGIATEEGDE